ncbi:MAG: hypothetical protein CML30_17650 [Rhizobiales bacterium]|nr:hypothetical protein [Hyphomicrobiales bacterium]
MASLRVEFLEDERCGLYFLAGLDKPEQGAPILTIHAARGMLNRSQCDFITRAARAADTEVDLRIIEHSDKDLRTPESLEDFAAMFNHDRILMDPTGAFSPMASLMETARRLRDQAGGAIRHILWQADGAMLVVVADRRIDEVRESVNSEIGRQSGVIKGAQVLKEFPSGRFPPVDRLSVVSRKETAPLAKPGFIARLAGIATLIGLGAISAATAAPATTVEAQSDSILFTPGMTALSGLTTLGENAYGRRNHYQAVGGLRLYFGEAGKLMAAALRPEAIYDGQAVNEFGDPLQDDFDHPLPLRVQSSS